MGDATSWSLSCLVVVRAIAGIALLCSCAANLASEPTIDSAVSGGNELDRLGFLDGCWHELIRARGVTSRLCWSREPDRWVGLWTWEPPPSNSASATHYRISELPEGLVLEYVEFGETTDRVWASRVDDDAIEFRRPDPTDPPGTRWRGPDLKLRYYAPSDQLWGNTFDEGHTFERAH